MDESTSGQGAANAQPARVQPPKEAPSIEKVWEEAKGKPCRVREVIIANEGSMRTRSEVIRREVGDLQQGTNIEEIIAAGDKVLGKLKELETFDDVEMMLMPGDEMEAEGDGGEQGEPGTCDAVLTIEEKNWIAGGMGAFARGHELSGEANLYLRNLLGYADSIGFSMEQNVNLAVQKHRRYALHYRKPRVYGRDIHAQVMLNQNWNNHLDSSSFHELLRRAQLSLRTSDGAHELAALGDWILLRDPQRRTSRSMQQQMGDHVKYGLRYTHRQDSRDSSVRPTSGMGRIDTLEASALTSDSSCTGLLKLSSQFQGAVPLSSQAELVLDASAGLLLPLASQPWDKPALITERLFLGGLTGELPLRGFRPRCAGPSEEWNPGRADRSLLDRNFVGADLACTVKAAIHFDLPGPLADGPLHGQLFVNGGNAVPLTGPSRCASLPDALHRFGSAWRCSIGAGLALPLAFGRFELNFVHVLRSGEFDRAKTGVEWGFASYAFRGQ